MKVIDIIYDCYPNTTVEIYDINSGKTLVRKEADRCSFFKYHYCEVYGLSVIDGAIFIAIDLP